MVFPKIVRLFSGFFVFRKFTISDIETGMGRYQEPIVLLGCKLKLKTLLGTGMEPENV